MVSIAAIASGIFFTHHSLSKARSELNEEIVFIANNIASSGSSLIITKDLVALELLLILNVSFHDIESILIVDKDGKSLSEVYKDSHGIHSRFSTTHIEPVFSTTPINVTTAQLEKLNFFRIFFSAILCLSYGFRSLLVQRLVPYGFNIRTII